MRLRLSSASRASTSRISRILSLASSESSRALLSRGERERDRERPLRCGERAILLLRPTLTPGAGIAILPLPQQNKNEFHFQQNFKLIILKPL